MRSLTLRYFVFGLILGIISFFLLPSAVQKGGLCALEKRYEIPARATREVLEDTPFETYENEIWTFLNNTLMSLALSYFGLFASIYKLGPEPSWFYDLIGFKGKKGILDNQFSLKLFPFAGSFLNGAIIGFISLFYMAYSIIPFHIPIEILGILLSARIGERFVEDFEDIRTEKDWGKRRKGCIRMHWDKEAMALILLLISSILEWSLI